MMNAVSITTCIVLALAVGGTEYGNHETAATANTTDCIQLNSTDVGCNNTPSLEDQIDPTPNQDYHWQPPATPELGKGLTTPKQADTPSTEPWNYDKVLPNTTTTGEPPLGNCSHSTDDVHPTVIDEALSKSVPFKLSMAEYYTLLFTWFCY